MPKTDLLEKVVICPICGETWKIVYKDLPCLKIFVKCKSCNECFEAKK